MSGVPIVCSKCGRRYAWKEELAGRTVKCACGVAISVPKEDDILDIAEPAALVARPAGRGHSIHDARVAAADAHGAQTTGPVELGYQTPVSKSDDEPTSPGRDLHAPLALLICGLVGIMLWAYISEGGKVAAIVYSAAAAITTAVKAGVIIAIALMIARSNDLSFGPVPRAVLKFAGIIAFADATAFWFGWFMEQIGLLPHGYTTIYAIALEIIITGVMIGFLCRMLFDIDHQETLMVGMLLGLLSWGLGFVLYWGMALGLEAATAPAMPTAPAPPAAATASPAPAPAPDSPVISETAADKAVSERLKEKMVVREAREYNQRSVIPQHARLVGLFYDAGAKGVWFDLGGSRGLRPTLMYVELPHEPEAREACFKLYVESCQQWRMEPNAKTATDQEQRYMVIPLPERKR